MANRIRALNGYKGATFPGTLVWSLISVNAFMSAKVIRTLKDLAAVSVATGKGLCSRVLSGDATVRRQAMVSQLMTPVEDKATGGDGTGEDSC